MRSTELVETMKEFLASIEAEYTFKEDAFRCDTTINDKLKNVCFIIHVDKNGYTISAIPEDVTVDETKTTDVSEYINMVNVETIGSHMSVYDDIVMCSCVLNCRGMVPNIKQIRECFVAIISCLEDFGEGLLDVIAGKGTPREIFKRYMEADRDV